MTPAVSLQDLSATLLELYRMAEQLAPQAFQDRALDSLQAKLPFDSAIWTSGHCEGGRWSIRRGHVAGLPARALEQYEPAQPAHVFMARWRLAHELAFVAVDPLTSLSTGITLYRRQAQAAFTDAERQFFQSAAVHMAENLGFAAIQQLLLATRSGTADISSCGVADRSGLLQVAPADFQRLLRLEWPNWHGHKLPEDICQSLVALSTPGFVGKRIVLRITTLSDVLLLQARAKRPADNLSQRELEVALLLAGGHTYKEAAQRLRVAPATVRNHIASIFAKLGVGKQSEMAVALRALD